MPTQLREYLITLALFASVQPAAAQGMQQQDKLKLNSTQEQAVTQGLASHPAHSVPGFSGQIGSKLPASETAQPLPTDVQNQVPAAKDLLFVKLPDRILLIDPDSKAVAEIVMAPNSATSPTPTMSR
jgi:hypothetical protein